MSEKFQEMLEKIELFLFRNDGVCILSKTKRSPELFTSMLAAIEAFSHSVSGLGAEEVIMGDNRIHFSRNGDIICAVITPESFNPYIGNAISKSIADLFVSKYGAYLAFWKGDLNDFNEFNNEIDEIIVSVLSSFTQESSTSRKFSIKEIIKTYGIGIAQIIYSSIVSIPIVVYGEKHRVEGIIQLLSNFFIEDAPHLLWVEPELVDELIKTHDFVIIGTSTPPENKQNVLLLSDSRVETNLSNNKYVENIANTLLEHLNDWADNEAQKYLSIKKKEFFKIVELVENLIKHEQLNYEALVEILSLEHDLVDLAYKVAKRNIISSQ